MPAKNKNLTNIMNMIVERKRVLNDKIANIYAGQDQLEPEVLN